MFHVSTIKNWFKGKAADFNKIAEYLNNLCGSGSIIVSRPDKPSNGSPPTISIDIELLKEELGTSFPKEPEAPTNVLSGVDDSEEGAETQADFTKAKDNTGAKLLVVSRAQTYSKEVIMLYFRPVTIAKDGRICKIGAESDGIAVYPGML